MFALYNDISELCSRIERQWLKYQNASEDFYKVAWEQSEGFDLSPLGEVANQMRLLEHPSVRLNQQRSTFSDLYFQLFNNGRFMIEVLNWAGSHVNVHDHDFSGVQFQLKGDAMNVVYDFEQEGETQGALRFGKLKVRHGEIWKQGGRSIVRAGAVDPHSVFHLGNPTTSLLIRTLPTARLGQQSNYFPTLTAHYSVNTDIQRKKLTGLSLLAKQDRKEFRNCFNQFLNSQSYSENFFMLLKLGELLFTDDFVDLIYAFAERGEAEAKIVHSVAFNNGIDFLKTKANQYAPHTLEEKLAVFTIAATHGPENMRKLASDLQSSGFDLRLREHLPAFGAKLGSQDRERYGQYLELFEMAGSVNV